jgi:cytochrome c oxidase subunit 5a
MTAFFQRKDIDGWDVRRGLQELFSIDGVPDPVTVSAALHACRRANDHSLAIRFMEAIKYKCGSKEKEIYPYLIQEIRPTLDQLGISTPEGISSLFHPSNSF